MSDGVVDGSNAVTVTAADRRAATEVAKAWMLGPPVRDSIAQAIATARREGAERMREREDARRYRRLQVLGCAPYGSENLTEGTVLRFTGLNAFLDADLKAHPSRGEADLIAPWREPRKGKRK